MKYIRICIKVLFLWYLKILGIQTYISKDCYFDKISKNINENKNETTINVVTFENYTVHLQK